MYRMIKIKNPQWAQSVHYPSGTSVCCFDIMWCDKYNILSWVLLVLDCCNGVLYTLTYILLELSRMNLIIEENCVGVINLTLIRLWVCMNHTILCFAWTLIQCTGVRLSFPQNFICVINVDHMCHVKQDMFFQIPFLAFLWGRRQGGCQLLFPIYLRECSSIVYGSALKHKTWRVALALCP